MGGLTRLGCALAGVMMTAPVHAATIEAVFEFSSSPPAGQYSSITLPGTNGVSVIVSAETYFGDAGLTVSEPGAGLGATHATDSRQQVDSNGAFERLLLRFSHNVTLTAITFASTDPWDRFELMSDIGRGLQSHGDFAVVPDHRVTGGDVANLFAIGAVGAQSDIFKPGTFAGAEPDCIYTDTSDPDFNTLTKRTCYSNFYVSGVTVRYDDAPSAVPLPAGAGLLATALAALGFAARRRTRRS